MPDDAPKPEAAAKPDDTNKTKKRVATGVAVGIGSAAIVAALLYANRSRKSDKDGAR
jgi:hypothetical protein